MTEVPTVDVHLSRTVLHEILGFDDPGHNIVGIAFDPASETVTFTVQDPQKHPRAASMTPVCGHVRTRTDTHWYTSDGTQITPEITVCPEAADGACPHNPAAAITVPLENPTPADAVAWINRNWGSLAGNGDRWLDALTLHPSGGTWQITPTMCQNLADVPDGDKKTAVPCPDIATKRIVRERRYQHLVCDTHADELIAMCTAHTWGHTVQDLTTGDVWSPLRLG